MSRTASCPIIRRAGFDATHDKREGLTAKSCRLSNDATLSKHAPGAYLLIESKSDLVCIDLRGCAGRTASKRAAERQSVRLGGLCKI